MFRIPKRVRPLLSGSAGVAEAPRDSLNRGRKNESWFDVSGIVSLTAPDARFNLNASEWQKLTGNFSAIDIPNATLSNTPFTLETAATYSFIIEAIAGPGGSKQRITVLSTEWEGERSFIRTASTDDDITLAIWKELGSFFSETVEGTTINTIFTTILTHSVDSDTVENITFLVYGRQTSGGTNRAFFEVAAFVENVSGVSVVIGATIIFAHKTIGITNVRVLDNATSDVLLQVRGSNANWSWRVEARFEAVKI